MCISPANIHPTLRPARSPCAQSPGHEEHVLYPYDQDYATSAERCRKMGERCGVTVIVEFEENTRTQDFWNFIKAHQGGVPGQKDTWRGPSQWTAPLNASGDRIGIYVGNPELLWLYIRAGEYQASEGRAAQMRTYSWKIREEMGDQVLGENIEKDQRRRDNDNRPEALDARR